MLTQAKQYITEGKDFLKQQQFEQAIKCFKKALALDQNTPEVWHLLGWASFHTFYKAEAGLQLRRALVEYQKMIDKGNDLREEHTLLEMACIYALLDNQEQCLIFLKKALRINKLLLETMLVRPELGIMKDLPSFQSLIAQEQAQVEMLTFKGHKLTWQQLNIKQKELIALVAKLLAKQHWSIDTYEHLKAQNLPFAPQIQAYFDKNTDIQIKIQVFVDTKLLFVELNPITISKEESQKFRVYFADRSSLKYILTQTIRLQGELNLDNWDIWVEAIITHCTELILEMPDGRRVKLS